MRLALPLEGAFVSESSTPAATGNTYAAWPSVEGFGLYLEVEVAVAGVPDATTGYLVDIGVIDRAVRTLMATELAPLLPTPPPPAAVAARLLERLPALLDRSVAAVLLRLTPRYSLEMESSNMARALLRQSFEFAASHRLHCPDWSEQRNREVFGKCSSPDGHGHNYRLEAGVEVVLNDAGGATPGLHAIEAIVRREVIDRFDHTHLNLRPEFRQLNPTVEHIAQVCHGLLAGPLREAGGRLQSVTVWETEKTSCTCFDDEEAGRPVA